MKNNLYFIANQGCDDTTHGLAYIDDDDFPKFKKLIENLNANSYYRCMPIISVYKISMDQLREVEYDSTLDCWDDGYVDRKYLFYLDDKTYTFAEEYFSYYSELELVIGSE